MSREALDAAIWDVHRTLDSFRLIISTGRQIVFYGLRLLSTFKCIVYVHAHILLAQTPYICTDSILREKLWRRARGTIKHWIYVSNIRTLFRLRYLHNLYWTNPTKNFQETLWEWCLGISSSNIRNRLMNCSRNWCKNSFWCYCKEPCTYPIIVLGFLIIVQKMF